MIEVKDSKPRRVIHWADVRQRRIGMWAYALNRITGIGLVFYLYLHLIVLSTLAQGATAWDAYIAIARTPVFLMLDVILLAGLLIHGLNGIRVTLTGLGIGVSAQKKMFVGLMLVAVIALIASALKIFEAV